MIVRQDWGRMRAWLIESLNAMDDGDILDIGDREAIEDDELVDCADVMRVEGGWILRLSRVALVDEVVVEDLESETWCVDELASDGVLLSADVGLVGDAVVCWFRDRLGVSSPGALGFSYSIALR